MPIYALDQRLVFPDPELADESGIIAIGGDLSPERVLLAYSVGIFPWPHEGYPLLWHSPDPRMVLEAGKLHVPASLKKVMKKAPFELRLDTAFREVITACAETPRPGQRGQSWITEQMIEAYCALHELGFAHSTEAWQDGQLVGGLYGVSLGGAYFGESMFARAPDASKVAFGTLVRQLDAWGIRLVDCQVHTEHLARFGAEDWPRSRYLEALAAALQAATTRRGKWRFD